MSHVTAEKRHSLCVKCVGGHGSEGEKASWRRSENICVSYNSKDLISRIYKELLQFNNKKTTPKNWAKKLNR